jgi:hypothetical protein
MNSNDQLGSDAQSLFNATRGLDEPHSSDRARIWRSLNGAIVTGAISATAATTLAATAAKAEIGGMGLRVATKSMLLKFGLMTAVTAGVGGSAYIGLRHVDSKEIPVVAATKLEVPQVQVRNTQEQLLAETKLLQSAQSNLREGRSELALAAIEEHASRFPNGVLSPERDASRVFALCARGSVGAARKAAASFALNHPTSPLLSKVSAACPSGKP